MDSTVPTGIPERSEPGLEPTLAPGDGAPADAVVVRAGAKDDYAELVAVDRRHYVVGREIAHGGMGRIMAARDRRLGRSVAIKELLVASADLRARFEREARITARLQHPSIVNLLEAGVWPDGEPFYVMKLVSGESLDKVIAARPTLEARLGLVANVIAAVDALAYAHNMRVIHRDLKPANVLVGEFGETVVIDWGLAKDLAESSAVSEAAGPYRAAPAVDGQTQAGAVMGTPAYMPVEQANGDPVDERADVYALGAMLYHVLAGAPPYTGRTSDIILVALIEGPPRPLDEVAPGVPPDLVAIVTKAMARAAADRYATAKELAADLKQFATGQLVGAHRYSTWELVRRWLRAHRTAVGVAAIAAVLLGVVGVVSLRRIFAERARTEEQRRLAVERGADAEGLISFMMTEMRDKLEPLGKLDLLDTVAQRAIAYYDRKDELTDGDKTRRSVALRNLGDVLVQQGHPDAAITEYRAALALAEELAARRPEPTLQWQVANCHLKLGETLATKDVKAALAEYATALELLERRAAADASPDRKADVAKVLRRIARLLVDRGDAAGALAKYREEIAIEEALVTQTPNDVRRRRVLADTYSQVGRVMSTQGDKAGAGARFRQALAIHEQLAAAAPENAVVQHSVLLDRFALGALLTSQGDRAGAAGELRAALTIAQAAATRDPSNADNQADLATCHSSLGDALLAADDAAGALAEYQAARLIDEQLAAKDPGNASAQLGVALDRQQIGGVLLARGDTAGALVEYRAFLAIAEQLAASDPANADRQRNVALGHVKIGDVLLAQHDAAQALTNYRAALATFTRRAESDPSNVDLLGDVETVHASIADALLAARDRRAALGEYQAALAIARTIRSKDPTRAQMGERITKLEATIATCCR